MRDELPSPERVGCTEKNIKKRLIEINKLFTNGAIRYEGELDHIEAHCKTTIKIALEVALRHPFMDGNKRTAIKYMEQMTGEKVPHFVYYLLGQV